MNYHDPSFSPDPGLDHAVNWLHQISFNPDPLPDQFPEIGLGEMATLDRLAPHILGRAARLDDSHVFAHMDPPTPWITWATALWNARLNQNLLHRSTAPFATDAEHRVIEWLSPYFGMRGGHMCSGSTLANLTGLWAARDAAQITTIVASTSAHLSIRKSAQILGLGYRAVPTDLNDQLDSDHLPDLTHACLVLTAGTTGTGSVDPLDLAGQAKWTHIDAAWSGPLRLSPSYTHLLNGIDRADSIAMSAHKWLFQPKESALILFRNPDQANAAISLGGSYLADPNIGIQGSRGAAAIPLLATLIAWGKAGLVERIDRTMQMADHLAEKLDQAEHIALWSKPKTGITVFRPLTCPTTEVYQRLPAGMLSTCRLQDQYWLRSVAANPLADIDGIFSIIQAAIPLI